MERKKKYKDEKKAEPSVIIMIIISVVLLIASCALLIYPRQLKDMSLDVTDKEQISRICELATLRCYYNNVAEFEDQPEIYKYGKFRYGYRKFFMEYKGVIEAGVNADEIEITKPDAEGVVCISMPEARILNVTADKDTLTEPVSDTGLWTSVTTDDIAQAFSEAQKNMKNEAEHDEAILKQAKENAKELIGQFVVNIGNLMGEEYTVKWIWMNVKGGCKR